MNLIFIFAFDAPGELSFVGFIDVGEIDGPAVHCRGDVRSGGGPASCNSQTAANERGESRTSDVYHQ